MMEENLTLAGLRSNEVYLKMKLLKNSTERVLLENKLAALMAEINRFTHDEININDILITTIYGVNPWQPLAIGVSVKHIPMNIEIRVFGRSPFSCKHRAMLELHEHINSGDSNIIREIDV